MNTPVRDAQPVFAGRTAAGSGLVAG